MKTKVCTKCGIEKQLYLKYFYKDSGQSSGFRPECRICRNKKLNIRRAIRLKTDELYKKQIHQRDNNRWKGKRRLNSILKYKKRTSDEKKESVIKSIYGITMADYYKMLETQNSVCAICGQKETRKHRYGKTPCRLTIDHNHITNKVRGLLCHSCNNGLGQFKDNIKNLEKAKKYLLRGI